MGTRSTIALELADGTVEQIYCHWDGYLSCNGKILFENYTDPLKVAELISLGAISSLENTVEATREHSYHFSRNEDLIINRYSDIDDYFENSQTEEYDYILRLNADNCDWYVRADGLTAGWVPLDRLLEQETSTSD